MFCNITNNVLNYNLIFFFFLLKILDFIIVNFNFFLILLQLSSYTHFLSFILALICCMKNLIKYKNTFYIKVVIIASDLGLNCLVEQQLVYHFFRIIMLFQVNERHKDLLLILWNYFHIQC